MPRDGKKFHNFYDVDDSPATPSAVKLLTQLLASTFLASLFTKKSFLQRQNERKLLKILMQLKWNSHAIKLGAAFQLDAVILAQKTSMTIWKSDYINILINTISIQNKMLPKLLMQLIENLRESHP